MNLPLLGDRIAAAPVKLTIERNSQPAKQP
jgi:hypothetical protein